MHNPAPSFTEEQIVFLLQRVDILRFLEQSCSYITQSLIYDGNLSAVRYAIDDAKTRVLIRFHGLLGC